jgi:outer membrane protein assembly factor BamB
MAVLDAAAGDWPMWRFDAGRTAASPHELPGELQPLWTRQFTPRVPVWDDPLNQDLMPYDETFEPIVLDKTLFIGFNDSDKIAAFDVDTGEERWAFFTDGPVRLPGVAADGKVYFACDDGYLYCLAADTGALQWRFRGGPSDRRVLGNKRLISTWPARGGPVLKDGRVYFAASIWPFMGTYIYALDAETGEVVWKNDSTSAQWIKQPHQNPAFAGVAPQGAFVISEDRLLVPGGRSVACCFDLATGKYLYYHLADYGKSGGSFVCAAGGVFYNHHRDQLVTMYDLAGGRDIAPTIGRLPVVTETAFYTSGPAIVACDIETARKKPKEWRDKVSWQLEVDASGDLIKAGSRFYAGGDGKITAIALPQADGDPQEAWSIPIDGKVERLIAADDKLFAVTSDGRVMAFGQSAGETRQHPLSLDDTPPAASASTFAGRILDDTGVTEGYAIVYGIGDGGLVEALARQSTLQIVAFEPNAEKVAAAREWLDAKGLYGTRIAVHQGDPLTVALPPYAATLSIVADPEAAGYEATQAWLERAYKPVRPYGGRLWIPLKQGAQQALLDLVKSSGLPGATASPVDSGVVLTREGPLPGAGTWTHQYGNAANTVKSDDDLVRMPLGLLWFGGSSNVDVLPRHGHGPPEQVIGGRLFIEGMECLSARDVYTGRVLWKTPLGDLGTFKVYYDETYKDTPTSTAYNQVHIPGSNARGTNYVATMDKVYVLQGAQCRVLDAATGEPLNTFTAPARKGEPEDWGYIGIHGDTLVAGAGFVPYSSLPAKGKLDVKDTKAYRSFWRYDKTASRELVVMDRNSGELRWRVKARHGFLHNGTVISNGTLYSLDKLPPYIETFFRRRGQRIPDDYRLLALNLQTGKVTWKASDNVFGTWLGYSKEHDVLLQATRPSGDMVDGESGKRMIAYKASTGDVLWDIERSYGNPPIIHGDKIITHSKMYSLLTGEPILRRDPLTGAEMPWTYLRTKGCGYHIASEHLVTFRSSAAGYFDLLTDGGTGHFGGFKSGCTSNLVAADGVLNAPDYTRTCSCSYQNQTSVAFVHDPDVEVWTTYPTFEPKDPILRVGINMGASGDRQAEDGTLWLEYPAIAGDSPAVKVRIGEATPDLVNRGAIWKYRDDGSDQGTAWREPGFDDSAWASAQAEFGYGDGDEKTVVSFGDDEKNKYITTYFRNTFDVTDPSTMEELLLEINHDDGAVVHLNGAEVYRISMPAGDVLYNTLASGGDNWDTATIPADKLRQGANTLAVEIHQSSPGSSDISFDLAMKPLGEGPEWIQHHSSLMEGEGLRWVGASCADGFTEMTLTLAEDAKEARAYTVRLYFAELQDAAPGDRVFSAFLQGEEMLKDFDIAKAAGGPRRTIVREFTGILVKDELAIRLTPSETSPLQRPLLSGVEVIAESEAAQGPVGGTVRR